MGISLGFVVWDDEIEVRGRRVVRRGTAFFLGGSDGRRGFCDTQSHVEWEDGGRAVKEVGCQAAIHAASAEKRLG